MSRGDGQSGRGAGPPIVALTGFMGSGKTTVGEELARLSGWEFVDLDAVIERQEGMRIREIFEERGEAGFRALEYSALAMFLSDCTHPAILALGGGAFVQEVNSLLLRERGVRTVFLETPVEELLRRCAEEAKVRGGNPRPLAADEASFRELYERRLPAYKRADLTVDTRQKSQREIAKEIANWLG